MMKKSLSLNQKITIRLTVIGLILAALGLIPLYFAIQPISLPSGTPTPASFRFSLLIAQQDNTPVPDADVILDIPGRPPAYAVTESNGYAAFEISSADRGKLARITIRKGEYTKRQSETLDLEKPFVTIQFSQ